MIKVNNLDFYIQDKKILSNISFSVEKGEFIGIIGANGSGKTTLLKCLNGINETKGKVQIQDRYLSEYPSKDLAKKISYMNQNTILAFDFACKKIIEFGRYPHKRAFEKLTREEEDLIHYYMEKTNTLMLSDKNINNISGGERQRVLFAKLLVQEAEILLLDEPTSALDIKYEEEIFRLISEEKKEHHTVLMSIHNIRNAIKYCDRLILLKDGKVLSDGTIEEVITKENIKSAYGIDVTVYYNTFSEQLDFYVNR